MIHQVQELRGTNAFGKAPEAAQSRPGGDQVVGANINIEITSKEVAYAVLRL